MCDRFHTKKEFVKCIALPQNEFDKFITDTPQDRKRSIAKLFNLENFGDNLNEKVKDRISVLNVKKSSLQEQLNAFGYVTKESQKQLSIKLNSLQKELGLCLKQSDKLKNDLNSMKKEYNQIIKDHELLVSEFKNNQNSIASSTSKKCKERCKEGSSGKQGRDHCLRRSFT